MKVNNIESAYNILLILLSYYRDIVRFLIFRLPYTHELILIIVSTQLRALYYGNYRVSVYNIIMFSYIMMLLCIIIIFTQTK